MDYQSFVNSHKSLVIAPAGYGKTFTIAECLKYVKGKQLILTHTHAGVASIKDKIAKAVIPRERYNVETISSYAQKYVRAFYAKPIPDQESDEYHPFLIEKATDLFKLSTVKDVIKIAYSGLIVDEYQDCTKQQHALVMALSEILPTHVLGDPLQGIFNFNGNHLVNFTTDLADFEISQLDTPYRWKNAGKDDLGEKLKTIRERLLNREKITLKDYTSDDLIVYEIESTDIYKKGSKYREYLHNIISNTNSSMLIIVPSYLDVVTGRLKGQISDRVRIKNQIDYNNSLILVEAIDDDDFYKIAKKIDLLITGISRARKKNIKIMKDLLKSLFQTTGLNNWFNDKGVKSKRDGNEKNKANQLIRLLDSFVLNPNANTSKQLLLFVSKELGTKCERHELLCSILNSLDCAVHEGITVYEAMKKHRNIIRSVGRKVDRKCIGTTLLTKGLEFDTVAILDAHLFNCPKHFYVALTRCRKKLFIFTEQSVLSY